ncbi:MerR family DNA-binding transcriptional regulator [bacterium]|nr:MerR family DNA-binding transcriptional regulator [bacterium]
MIRRVSVKTIAEKTNVAPSTLRNWIDEGILPAERDFRGWRWFPRPDETIQRVTDLIYGKVVDKELPKVKAGER